MGLPPFHPGDSPLVSWRPFHVRLAMDRLLVADPGDRAERQAEAQRRYRPRKAGVG
jgi:hypothetical protein